MRARAQTQRDSERLGAARARERLGRVTSARKKRASRAGGLEIEAGRRAVEPRRKQSLLLLTSCPALPHGGNRPLRRKQPTLP